jgi:hypothetical protein
MGYGEGMTNSAHKFTAAPLIDLGCGCYDIPVACSCGWEHTARTVAEAGTAVDTHWRTRNAATA